MNFRKWRGDCGRFGSAGKRRWNVSINLWNGDVKVERRNLVEFQGGKNQKSFFPSANRKCRSSTFLCQSRAAPWVKSVKIVNQNVILHFSTCNLEKFLPESSSFSDKKKKGNGLKDSPYVSNGVAFQFSQFVFCQCFIESFRQFVFWATNCWNGLVRRKNTFRTFRRRIGAGKRRQDLPSQCFPHRTWALGLWRQWWLSPCRTRPNFRWRSPFRSPRSRSRRLQRFLPRPCSPLLDRWLGSRLLRLQSVPARSRCRTRRGPRVLWTRRSSYRSGQHEVVRFRWSDAGFPRFRHEKSRFLLARPPFLRSGFLFTFHNGIIRFRGEERLLPFSCLSDGFIFGGELGLDKPVRLCFFLFFFDSTLLSSELFSPWKKKPSENQQRFINRGAFAVTTGKSNIIP